MLHFVSLEVQTGRKNDFCPEAVFIQTMVCIHFSLKQLSLTEVSGGAIGKKTFLRDARRLKNIL